MFTLVMTSIRKRGSLSTANICNYFVGEHFYADLPANNYDLSVVINKPLRIYTEPMLS